MIDASFVKAIGELAQQARTPKLISVPGVTDRCWLDQAEILIPPPARAHEVQDLASFCRAVAEFGSEDASVWYAEGLVIGLLGDGRREDRVVLRLHLADQFKAVAALDKGEPRRFDQRGMIWFLRHSMAKALADPGLVPLFRTFSFQQRNTGNSTIEHGKESLGRSVEAACTAGQTMPEWIEVRVPFVTEPTLAKRYPILLMLEILTTECLFQLVPEPGALDAVVAEFTANLHSALDSHFRLLHEQAQCQVPPLFYGLPEGKKS